MYFYMFLFTFCYVMYFGTLHMLNAGCDVAHYKPNTLPSTPTPSAGWPRRRG